MDSALEVVIAHQDAHALETLAAAVSEHHEVIARCARVTELMEAVASRKPGLIVSGTAFDDGDGLAALIEICRESPIPAVVVTAERSLELVKRAMLDHVMAYLLEPVRPDDLHAAIVLAQGRHAQLMELAEEVDDLRQALDDRKVIEKAKGTLMASEGLTEPEAFAQLRRRAQNERRKLVDVARDILGATASS